LLGEYLKMSITQKRSNGFGKSITCQGAERHRSGDGFSLLELLITVAIGFTVIAIAVIALIPGLRQQHITAAYNATLTTLRRAHDQAAADMRVYVVTFATPGTITVTQNTLGGPLLVTSVLPPDVTLHNAAVETIGFARPQAATIQNVGDLLTGVTIEQPIDFLQYFGVGPELLPSIGRKG
jgi:Tfp pilus assembly protein FimT